MSLTLDESSPVFLQTIKSTSYPSETNSRARLIKTLSAPPPDREGIKKETFIELTVLTWNEISFNFS